MEKVQTGFVIEFYSNACLVRTKVGDIPCIAIKDVVVGDIVKIEIIQDSKEIKGLIVSKNPRKSTLQKKDGLKSKTIAANITHVGILLQDHRIIHAHGKVRIDPIDQTGIFNKELQTHSHKLRMIKKII